jgi:hypothetical protein
MIVSCRTSSRDDAQLWNRTMGAGWSQILRSASVGKNATVVEAGPGFSDKIAHALAALGFRGRIVLVDPTPAAGRWLRFRYRQLLPAAEIVVDPFPLSSATREWGTVHALVSNHVLDDMLLRLAVPPAVSRALFAQMRPGRPCSRSFLEAWRHVQEDPAALERLVGEAADEFARYAAAIAPHRVIVNEYPSWTHVSVGLASVHDHGLRALNRLEDRFNAAGFLTMPLPVPPEPRNAAWLLMSGPARTHGR